MDTTKRTRARGSHTQRRVRTHTLHVKGDTARQQLGDVLDRVSDAVVALDTDWRYTYVNHHAAKLFGRNPEDLVGKHIWTEFPEGVGQPFHRAYEKAMAEQIFIQMESYYEPWNRWFENRIYPAPEGLSIFFHEITERKLSEQSARESAELLAAQNRVLELIARGAPLNRSLDVLLRELEARCPGMLCSILLLDPDGVHVRHGAAPSLPESFIRAVDGQSIGPHAGSCGTATARPSCSSNSRAARRRARRETRPPRRRLEKRKGAAAAWSTRRARDIVSLYRPIRARTLRTVRPPRCGWQGRWSRRSGAAGAGS